MTGKRSKFEIYLEILTIMSKEETKPTRIMYETNLSWVPFQEYLKHLIDQNNIKEIENNKRKEYLITDKGIKAIKYFEEIIQLIKV